ncbi:hypothetical protein [Streptomyces sp. NBC_00057]|uniref:hypothetical protein n=1 Tax=Streptomyces sp. NBC_00057 TaxID=2975634 RepID=UPI002F918CA6
MITPDGGQASSPLTGRRGGSGALGERLSGWQQDRVEAAAKAELPRLAGLLVRPEAASQLLADRLTVRPESAAWATEVHAGTSGPGFRAEVESEL